MAKKGKAMRRKAKPRKVKALVLLSGGLDSRLVCRLMQEQLGKDGVETVFFALPFGGGCCSNSMCVVRFAQVQGIRLHVVDCTRGAMFRRYMKMIMKPRFGRGAAFNPCIDCHLFMLKEAKKIAAKEGIRIIATGEVLGERPMSQNRHALELIEKEADASVLRPLSAKLLPETEAERKGWIDRDKMLAISGRRRTEQLALAKKYRIDYPSPGGGCLLTDESFSARLAGILRLRPDAGPDETGLAKLGRHFPIGVGTKKDTSAASKSAKEPVAKCKAIIIVGRNHQENIKIAALAGRLGLPTLEVDGVMGPTTTIISVKPAASARTAKASVTKGKAQVKPSHRSKSESEPVTKGAAQIPKPICRAAALLTARYSDAPKGQECSVCVKSGKKLSRMAVMAPQDTGFLLKKR